MVESFWFGVVPLVSCQRSCEDCILHVDSVQNMAKLISLSVMLSTYPDDIF